MAVMKINGKDYDIKPFADLSGANLIGANLIGAVGVMDFGTPYNWRVVVVRHPGGVRISVGCRWFTFKEAASHWKKRGKERNHMIPILACIKARAKIDRWKL